MKIKGRKFRASLQMALAPIGPFCPFRSEAADSISPKVEELQQGDAAHFVEDFGKIQSEMMMGKFQYILNIIQKHSIQSSIRTYHT